jgi:hypothetical protein
MRRKSTIFGLMLTFAIFLMANAAFSQVRNVIADPDRLIPVQIGLTPNTLPDISSQRTTIISENFDGFSFPPSGWTTANPDGGSGWTWGEVGTTPIPGWNGGTITSPFAGAGVAFCTWITGGAESSDQYLITPQISLPAGQRLDFWLQKWPDAYMDSVQVLISTTGNQADDFTTVLADYILEWYTGNTDWAHHSIDLSAYSGQDVYLAFREYSAITWSTAAVFLDQVTVGDPPVTPVVYLNYTAADFGIVDVGQTSTLTGFRLTNIGSGTLTASDVTFSNPAFSSSLIAENVSLEVDASYDFDVMFSPTVSAQEAGTMTIVTNGGTVTIELTGTGFQMPEGMIQVGHDNYIGLGLPMDASWGYTYSQSIYKQPDLNISDKRITKIQYRYIHYSDYTADPYTDSIRIFMGHTQANSLEAWNPINQMVEVFRGTLTSPGYGDQWIELNLTFPFTYNNQDNLVVAFYEYTPDMRSWDDYFVGSNSDEVVSMRYRSDGEIDIHNPPVIASYGYIQGFPNVRLQFEDLLNEPILVVLPNTIDYGYVQTGNSASADVSFSNFGGSDLHITGVTGLSAPYSMNAPVITVAPGATSAPTTIYFHPTTTGRHNQTLTFTSDATNTNNTVALTGYSYSDPIINEFPYVMGFEGDDEVFPAYGWSTNGWFRGLIPYAGEYSAGVPEWIAGEHTMMTPVIDLPESMRITFWWADNNNDFQGAKSAGTKSPLIIGQDTTFFEVSADLGATWTNLATLSAPAPEQWHKQWIDLGEFATDSLLLRWRDVTNGDYYAAKGVALDEVVIEYNSPDPQVSVNYNLWDASIILVGDSTISGPVFTLQNVEGGILTVSSITDLSGTGFTTTFVPGDVSLGLGETYNFGFTYYGNEIGVDNAVFQIITNGGSATVHLTGEATTIGEFTSESFDGDIFPPLGWKNIDADGDGYKWRHGNDPTVPFYSTHSGIGCAYSSSWDWTILFPDNYLITPEFTVTDQKNALVWWVSPHGSVLNDHYSVEISNGSFDPNDFTILYEETILVDAWVQHSIDLSAYEGQLARIAFRHKWSTQKWHVKLDDVSVIPLETVNAKDNSPEKMVNVYPNPATDHIIINSTEVIQRVSVFNTMGAMLSTTQINDISCQINSSSFSNGLYILRIETDKGVVTKRVNVIR